MPVSKLLCTDLQTNFMMCISFLPVLCCWLCVIFFIRAEFSFHIRVYMCMHTESLIQSFCSSYYHVYVKIHGGHMWLCPGYAENALMHTFKMPSNKVFLYSSFSLARSDIVRQLGSMKRKENSTKHDTPATTTSNGTTKATEQHIMAGTKW